jgi:hypothetical protein
LFEKINLNVSTKLIFSFVNYIKLNETLPDQFQRLHFIIFIQNGDVLFFLNEKTLIYDEPGLTIWTSSQVKPLAGPISIIQVSSNLSLFPVVRWRHLIKFLTIFYSRYTERTYRNRESNC